MSTFTKIYRSTDAGATALTLYGNIPGSTGGAGSIIGILRACLINGYNTQTASSVVVATNVATFNATAHGFLVGQCVLIAGATPAGLNGEQYVTSVSPNSFTFATSGITDQTATGTITAKMAPAGWTEPFASATNITAFRQGAGNMFYLNIDETAVQVSRVTGFESMTAVGIANGTNAFPTTAQFAGGLYWNRSGTTDTIARPWVIVANDRTLYMHVNVDNNATSLIGSLQGLTDLKIYKTGDVYATLIMGQSTATVATNGTGFTCSPTNVAVAGHYLTRSHTQIGTSIAASKCYVDNVGSTVTALGSIAMTYPVAVDNGLWLSPVRVSESSINSFRGEMTGLWAPMHNKPLNHLDTFSGTGALAGKTFIALNGYNVGQIMLETSNTWSL